MGTGVGYFMDGNTALMLVCSRLWSYGWNISGQQEILEHEVLGGIAGQYLYCKLASFAELAKNMCA